LAINVPPSVQIAVPTRADVRAELSQILTHLAANDHRYRLHLSVSDGQPIAHNRNMIAKRFLAAGVDYLLMIDSDAAPTGNPLDLVEQDLDVVGFPSPTWRANDPAPLVWNPCPPGDGIVEVEWVSTSVILIARRVLEQPALRAPFCDEFDADGARTLGEDQTFCRRAREVGFRVWCAANQPACHWKTVELLTLWRWLSKTS